MNSRDEYLERVTIGERQVHGAVITLADYDPNWPFLFMEEAEALKKVLGERALRIHHVGSTSVPGLCAKPIIDMLLVVENSADEPAYVPDLTNAGYVLRIREPEWFEHRMFKGPRADINLHVFGEGTEEIDRMLRFRDWLRSHDADRQLYADAKRELARRKWKYVQHYADAKSEVIGEIVKRAFPDSE